MIVSTLRSSAALACIFAAGAAQADLTAKEVWTDWRDYMASSGYEVTSREQMSGNTLTLGDITLNLVIPEEDAQIAIVVPQLDLIENGDGSVSAQYPSPLPIRFGFVEDGEEVGSGELIMTHSGTTMKITGDPSNITYDHSADMVSFELGSMMAEGQAVPAEIAQLAITLMNTAGTTRMIKGNRRDFEQSYTAASMTYAFAFDDPTSSDKGSFKGQAQGLSVNAKGSIPFDIDSTDMAAMIKAGFAVDASIAYTGGSSDIAGTADGDNFTMQSTSQGGAFNIGMDANRLAYGLGSTGLSVNVASGELPFPVSFDMAEIGFQFSVPVSKSDTPQDFAIAVTLRDFNTTDMIWGLADPGGVLPHDPVTFVVDLAGKAKLLVDLMDPEAAESFGMNGVPPGELHAISVRDLLVKAIGAQLTGQGDFTIDNTQSFNGMPKPTGAIDLTLDGANALIDNLIKMGIVSDQDAMGARMMMGMLAVPGDGPDQLKSRLEINEQGHVLANGQRIQ